MPSHSTPAPAPLCEIDGLKIGFRGHDGVVTDAVRDLSLTLAPGERLGIVEESDVSELIGCAVYACDGAEPSYRVLLLLDGEYLLFEHTEPDGE